MKKSITPRQIKLNNRQLIYRFVYDNPRVSQQEVANRLGLSRPTVTNQMSTLEKRGFITKDGLIESEQAGRKAAAYSIVADFRVAIGVELTEKEVKVIAVDLYGIQLKRIAYPLEYSNTTEYYEAACDKIKEYIKELKIRDEQILGIGIAVQALVSEDQKNIIYGKIMDCTGLSIDVFTRHLPYPCNFIHDSAAAAASELWASPELVDAFYIAVGNHLGAAMIVDRTVPIGKHGHSATVEHVTLFNNGKKCYCGREGCIETECSLSALLKDGETVEEFFEKLEAAEAGVGGFGNGDSEYVERWANYLHNFAKAISALHLIYDTDFIVGGYIAPFLRQKDIDFLTEEAAALAPFDEDRDFITISQMPKHNITIGAALSYLRDFLEENA